MTCLNRKNNEYVQAKEVMRLLNQKLLLLLSEYNIKTNDNKKIPFRSNALNGFNIVR